MIWSLVCSLLFVGNTAHAQKPTMPYQVKTVFDTRGIVWGFDWVTDDQIIYTLRSGQMYLYNALTQKHALIQNVPKVYADGQGGLLDVVLHPDFPKQPWVYFSYSVQVNRAFETRISRAKLQGQKLTDIQILFTSASGSTKSVHFGSRIVFDGRGHIFFGVGDRGQRNQAQSLSTYNGKIYRLTEDGRVPADNPFVKDKKALDAIWSYGHRNPQGLYYDAVKGKLWEHEHGPRGGDELNIIMKAKNYGWPIITYGREYYGPKINEGLTRKPGMEQPEYFYVPSIAPSGLAPYQGTRFPTLEGAFIIGALAKRHVNILIKEGSQWIEKRWLENRNERIRDVDVRNGYIFVSTDSGKLLRLAPRASN